MADGQVLIEIDGDAAKYKAALGEVNASTQATAGGIAGAAQNAERTSVASMAAIGKVASTVGKGLTAAVTVPLVAIGAYSTNAAITFESSFAGVRKTVDATEEEFQALSDAAREMSTTKPVDVNDVNQIMELGGQLGIAKENLVGFADVVSDLDVATNLGIEDASTELAQFMNITGTTQDKVSNLGSTVVALGNTSATTEADIMSMAMRIAGAGSQIGMTDDQILGMSAALSSVGIEAEAGGTAISTVMSQIDKDVATNGETLGVWAETAHMSVEEFTAAWSEDAAGTLQRLFEGMGTSGENLNVVLDEMGVSSLRQTDMMKRMSNASELLGSSLDTASSAWQQNTALTDEASRRYETTESKIQIMKNKLNDVAIDIGGPLADALSEVLDNAGPVIDAIKNMANAFIAMDDGSKKTIISIAAIAAAAGPMLMVFGKLTSAVAGFKDDLSKLSSVSSSAAGASSKVSAGITSVGKASTVASVGMVALGAAAVALLGVAIYKQYSEWKEKTETLDKATDGLHDTLNNLTTVTASTGSAAKESASDFQDYSAELQTASEEAWKGVQKQAEFADSLRKAFADVNGSSNQLDSYKATIEQLGGRSDLTATEVGKFKDAIENVNSSCGSNYQVVQDASGAYIVMRDDVAVAKDEIYKLIDAQKAQMMLDVTKDQLSEAYKAQAEAASDLTEKENTLKSVQDGRTDTINQLVEGGMAYDTALGIVNQDEQKAQGAVDSAKKTYDGYSDTIQRLTDNQTLYATSLEDGVNTIADTVVAHAKMQSALESNEQSVVQFTDTLNAAGVNTEQFASLNDEQLTNIANAYDGNFSSIQSKLEEYGVSFDAAAAQTAVSSGSISETTRQMAADVGVALESTDTEAIAQQKINDYSQAIAMGATPAQAQAYAVALATGDGMSQFDAWGIATGKASEYDSGIASGNPFGAASGQAGAAGAGFNTVDGLTPGSKGSNQFASSIGSASGAASSNASSMANSAKSSLDVDTSSSGSFFSQGFANGIAGGIGWAMDAAANLAQSAWNALKAAGGEGSPWKTTIASGEFAAQGLAVGIKNKASEAKDAAAMLGKSAAMSLTDNFDTSALTDIAKSIPDELADRAKGYTPIETSALISSVPSTVLQQLALTSTSSDSGASIYNVYVDGAVVNDTPAIQSATYSLLTELQRKGRM